MIHSGDIGTTCLSVTFECTPVLPLALICFSLIVTISEDVELEADRVPAACKEQIEIVLTLFICGGKINSRRTLVTRGGVGDSLAMAAGSTGGLGTDTKDGEGVRKNAGRDA